MSFELEISPRQRAGSRLISSIRKQLVLAADEQGATQQAVADKLQVNRSVINRLLRGTANLTVRTVGELAWALNLDVVIIFRRKKVEVGTNSADGTMQTWTVNQGSTSTTLVTSDQNLLTRQPRMPLGKSSTWMSDNDRLAVSNSYFSELAI